MNVDVAIAGGGPAGLAAAIHAARAGLSVAVFEREALPRDKACGEGLMPPGLRALERLGARAGLGAADWAPIRGIRYVQEDGSALEGRFPEPAASASGAPRWPGCCSRRPAKRGSPSTRKRPCALTTMREGRTSVANRRRHLGGERFWSPRMAWLRPSGRPRDSTPRPPGPAALACVSTSACGPGRTASKSTSPKAWRPTSRPPERSASAWPSCGRTACVPPQISWSALVQRFPALGSSPSLAPSPTPRRAAPGPCAVESWRASVPASSLLGDAAGYVDAITGEGLSLALVCAEALGACLPEAVSRRGEPSAFGPYLATCEREYRRYALVAGSVLWLARHPLLRRSVLAALGLSPDAFSWLLAHSVA